MRMPELTACPQTGERLVRPQSKSWQRGSEAVGRDINVYLWVCFYLSKHNGEISNAIYNVECDTI